MDVTCDRCGTEYEFEEPLVSTRGTTVKCTDCGHLFKVYRPQAPADALRSSRALRAAALSPLFRATNASFSFGFDHDASISAARR